MAVIGEERLELVLERGRRVGPQTADALAHSRHAVVERRREPLVGGNEPAEIPQPLGRQCRIDRAQP